MYGSIKSVDICKCSDLVCCVEAVLLGYCWRLSCTALLLLEAVLYCLVTAVLSFFSKIPWSVLSYLAELVGVVFTCNLLDGAKCSIL